MPPVYVIEAEFLLDRAHPTLVCDDAGQPLVFAHRRDGALCAVALLETCLYARVTVVPVWWPFIERTTLAKDDHDPAEPPYGEVEGLTTRAALVEPGRLNDVEAQERARDLAERVVVGLRRQVGRVLGHAAATEL